jgi:predicted transcriptional regulator
MHKITALESFGNPGYFENSGMYTEVEKILLKYIRNDKDCRIFRLLMEEPNLNRNSLGKYLGISPSTVSWHIKRLCGENLIFIRKAGRNVFYEINPEIHQYLEKYIVQEKGEVFSKPSEQISESV